MKQTFKFSQRSLTKLKTCCIELQSIMHEAIKHIDFTIVCGRRSRIKQNKAYRNGYSNVKFPYSMHNLLPSAAVDIVPYPSGYKDIHKFIVLSKIIKRIAKKQKIRLKWGGDFKATKTRAKGWDKAHWELVLT